MLTEILTRRLLAERADDGRWVGRLASSALSTAVGGFALSRVDSGRNAGPAGRALEWLTTHVNADGGWGDTVDSPSNLSTTLLAWSALGLAGERHRETIYHAGEWMARRTGDLSPASLASAVSSAYGDDRTFSAPILAFCALAGRLGPEPEAWALVPQLPFELAVVPRRFYSLLRLPVVSYALPALIAIGLVRHVRAARGFAVAAAVRNGVTGRVLGLLSGLQPEGGGFLEAAPLTGFVAASLAGAGHAAHPVARQAADFLRRTQRDDGSWPIDTDLAVWVTTGAASALASTDPDGRRWDPGERAALRRWLIERQYRTVHPFTGAAPGGWGWSDRSGAVPDADDTAGALLALRALGPVDDEARAAAEAGVGWLLDLQNRDGGFPTFCRGWGRLPFDRSCPDLAAHALRAMDAWREDMPPRIRARILNASRAALDWLEAVQNSDGSWTPLWFGNQRAPGGENRTYGTAQVLRGLESASGQSTRPVVWTRAVEWLVSAQNPDGGWGGGMSVASTVEETALAVTALSGARLADPVRRGLAWLAGAWKRPEPPSPSPIGLYFARLWYSERLYPLIFSLQALGSSRGMELGAVTDPCVPPVGSAPDP